MSGYRNPLIVTVIWVLVAAGLGFAYEADRIGAGTLLFLGILALTLGVIVAIFLRRLSRPADSVEQMLYKTDHPTRT